MGEIRQLAASDGHHLDAYVADPRGAPRGGLVIVQEIFGINSHIKDVCDGFAADGYLCVAPALFDRVKNGIEFGYGPEDYESAMTTRRKLDWDGALRDVAAAHDCAQAAGKVGIVGYCYGGSVAWLSATRQNPSGAVSYYGGAVAEFSSEKPRCPTICHVGALDKAIPAEKIAVIRANRPEVAVYVYENAGHGFNCDQRDSWNEAAARLARSRTLDHLRTCLG